MNQQGNGEDLFSQVFDIDSMTADERMKTGEIVKRARELRGLTRQELAEAAGVDRTTLRSLEAQTRATHIERLKSIFEALGLPQKGDVESRYGARTRSFIVSTAPIFDSLPAHIQDEAQHDVVVLLAGKLARARGSNALRVVEDFDTERGSK